MRWPGECGIDPILTEVHAKLHYLFWREEDCALLKLLSWKHNLYFSRSLKYIPTHFAESGWHCAMPTLMQFRDRDTGLEICLPGKHKLFIYAGKCSLWPWGCRHLCTCLDFLVYVQGMIRWAQVWSSSHWSPAADPWISVGLFLEVKISVCITYSFSYSRCPTPEFPGPPPRPSGLAGQIKWFCRPYLWHPWSAWFDWMAFVISLESGVCLSNRNCHKLPSEYN